MFYYYYFQKLQHLAAKKRNRKTFLENVTKNVTSYSNVLQKKQKPKKKEKKRKKKKGVSNRKSLIIITKKENPKIENKLHCKQETEMFISKQKEREKQIWTNKI